MNLITPPSPPLFGPVLGAPIAPDLGHAAGAPPGSTPARRQVRQTAVTLEAPLIGVESARLALRCGENDLIEWIHSGDIEWAFDLRRLNSRRAYLRILTESVVAMQQRKGRITPRERAAQRDHPFQEVFDSIFKHPRPFLLSTELARFWGCGTSHIHNLVQDGLLRIERKNYAPHEAFQILRENTAQFMQSRRIK